MDGGVFPVLFFNEGQVLLASCMCEIADAANEFLRQAAL